MNSLLYHIFVERSPHIPFYLSRRNLIPAIDGRFPRYPKIFGGRQAARSLHFLGMVAFVLFIVIHVVIERFPENMGNIVLGQGESTSLGVAISLFAFYATIIFIIHVWATAISLRKPRLIQNGLDLLIVPLKYCSFVKQFPSKNILDQRFHSFFV